MGCGETKENWLKIYLSAGFGGQKEMREVARAVEALGHYVTSTWLFEMERTHQTPEEHERWMRGLADTDAMDIHRAGAIAVFSHWKSTSGGRHWELGYAEGLGKELMVVGERENPFHYMADVRWFPEYEDFLGYMKYRGGVDATEPSGKFGRLNRVALDMEAEPGSWLVEPMPTDAEMAQYLSGREASFHNEYGDTEDDN